MSGKPTTRIRCKACGDVIQSRWFGDFRTCKCGAIHIDEGRMTTRTLWPEGNPHDHIEYLPPAAVPDVHDTKGGTS